jgi:hypothetical protein
LVLAVLVVNTDGAGRLRVHAGFVRSAAAAAVAYGFEAA